VQEFDECKGIWANGIISHGIPLTRLSLEDLATRAQLNETTKALVM